MREGVKENRAAETLFADVSAARFCSEVSDLSEQARGDRWCVATLAFG